MTSAKKKITPLVVLVVCLVIVFVPDIPNSYAHALVVKSNPSPGESLSSPPESVSVTFSDPVDLHYSKIKVLDSNGNEVDNKDDHYVGTDQETLGVTIPSNMPNGIYTVSTKVLDQTDGHVTEDAFVFGVGETIPQTAAGPTTANISDVISIPFSIARFPALLGQVIVVGTTFLSLWMWKPVARITWLDQSISRTKILIEKNTVKLVLIGASILVAADIGMIVAEAISINASLSDAVLTKFGQSWVIRMVLSSALLVISYLWYRNQKNSEAILSKSWKWLVFGLGIAVLVTDTMISHAAATGLALPPTLDFVHDLAASFWVGGLLYGAFAVLPSLKKSQDHLLKLSVMSIMIPRFTILVVAVLGVVAVTGPALLYTLENNFSLTLVSIYGKILIIKLLLAAAMIALGGYHEVATRSKALGALKQISSFNGAYNVGLPETQIIESKFHRNIFVEALIGIALIASVAVLVDSGLPATEYQNQLQQISLSAFAVPENPNTYTETSYAQDGNRVVLTIDPYYSGSNKLNISFLDSQGNIIPMQSARLTYTQVDRGIGPVVENVQPNSQGIFTVSTNTFAISGHWNLQIEGVQSAANSLNIIGTYNDLYLTPKINTISASIKEYEVPQNDSRPLFPVYDKIRNTIWIGDAQQKSGRIFSFDLGSKTFAEHRLQGVNDVTSMELNNLDDTLWYIDPITKIVGNYNPDTNANQIYQVSVPQGGILSGLAVDGNGNVWISVSSISNVNQLLKFDPMKKGFSTITLSPNSQPQGLAVDDATGYIWIAESGIGKIARFNPTDNSIREYPEGNGTLATPTAILIDPLTGKIFVSEHDGREISAFDPILKTFTRYPLDSNQQDLPFGMSFDTNHDLWVAQHTQDKISVINPRTGETNEFSIPSTFSLVQHITTDSQGNIILIEEGTHTLGILTATAGLAPLKNVASFPFAYPGIGLGVIAGPSIAAVLVALSFFYTKSIKDMNETIVAVNGLARTRKNSGPI